MRFAKIARRFMMSSALAATVLTSSALLFTSPTVMAQGQPVAIAPATVGDLSARIWDGALSGGGRASLAPLSAIPAETANPALQRLRESNTALEANFKKAEEVRASKLAEAWKDLEARLAEPEAYPSLSKALKAAIEIELLAPDRMIAIKDPRMEKLVAQADAFARKAEKASDWLIASDLFFRLNAFLDEEGRYRADVTRLSNRLEMLRLYVPQRLWELRNAMMKDLGEKPIAPYNPLGESYAGKLKGIDDAMMTIAIERSAKMQVDHTPTTYGTMLVGGLDAIENMVTTQDLQRVFPEIGNTDARQKMLDFLDQQRTSVAALGKDVNYRTMTGLVNSLSKTNDESVKLPREALLHEFGNGAMGTLDEFSAIIWPDEKARFDRMTQGEFTGIGVQIQVDPDSQAIKIVTPLDDTPAQRAGIHAGDIIKKINGESAFGLTLTQAVELITGPRNTPVTVTVEREGKDLDFPLIRAVIPVVSVKGWKRLGPKEDQWDWFIDPENKIGYVRLLQFTDDTTLKLKGAIEEMQKSGLNGLVLDLRFNPGGLLTQAESVANAFIDKGVLVSTTSGDSKSATASLQLVKDIPVAVLINEGSASASEIVSGAMKHYADTKQIRAIVIGTRSYGKGSVQNVWPLDAPRPTALLKLTTQYYKVPSSNPEGYILHRRPGAKSWGIDSHLRVDMLPDQIADAIKLRQDADVVTIDETGLAIKGATPPPDPMKLITDGIDLQLETALVVLQSQVVGQSSPRASLD
ncbi:MAG: S41 family peptidase [Pyrinomonadaceae bacterium]|nr:S41 family peptidase [Phycisphaerales bacterium]